MLKVAKLKCEYLENPIGIGEIRPRFGWIIESDIKNVMQKTFRLQVATDDSFVAPLWDTGVVNSSESAHIEYDGPPLMPSTRYFYRVKITDNHGQESPWSDTGFFETALLDVSQWKARFISPEDSSAGKSSKGKFLRHEFTLDGEITFARVYVTALGMYELYINGKRVGDDLFTPGWTSYKKRLQYQTYDVTNLLKNGVNAVGAVVGCGWYKGDLAGWLGRRNVYGSQTALLLQMLVRYVDGREQIVVTDETWKASDSPILYSEIYHGEIYDARLEQPGWNMPGFDDSNWHSVEVVEYDMSTLTPQDGLPVRRQEMIKPISMFMTPKGERVIDFGQNIAGWVKFTVKGNPGDKVVLKHAEVLDAAGNFYTENLRSAKQRIEYILKGGETETFEPHFTFQGFRYVMIEEYPGEPSLDAFTAVVIHSDMEPTGSFSCSNELINQLQHNILWGLKGNFIDVPTDCPQRDERLGWTGDAQVFIRTACFLMNTAPFFKKWLRDLKADQLEDGGVPYVIPDVLGGSMGNDKLIQQDHSSAGWGDAAVICPWTIYLCYGDKRILKEQYESMKGWVEYIRAHAQNGVLWNTGFHFGDWLALDAKEGSYFGATPNDLVATAFYAYSTELLVRAAKILGKEKDAEEYSRLHANIVKAFQDEFFTPSGRLAVRTQTAHILALMFNLVPDQHRARTIDTLIALLNENGGHLTTGFLGTPYFCHVLSQNGKLDAAYSLLLKDDYPSWLYQVKKGATTVWEHWDGIKPDGSMWSADMNSFNHYAYGAIGDWLYRVVAGLDTDPDMPGYKRILIRPQPGGGLTYAEAQFTSVYGKIAVKWSIEGDNMIVDVTVPPNTTAHVTLPRALAETVNADDISFINCPGGAEAEIGSGNYRFVYPYKK
ncbi:family 78 glycoside hydrolase catalytic domain [Caldanaerobius polysaccharolyticus]|uniref:family 78 glycoside hydrolase catalytic domain n=1 Tax=Caldanaerobius polysaccharolyticus TaxID=44256 RepID=UPI00047C286D|nr:family 78 glycoside hydrolase catalytic domain [Caldanaerobius polysaccharolyticus]